MAETKTIDYDRLDDMLAEYGYQQANHSYKGTKAIESLSMYEQLRKRASSYSDVKAIEFAGRSFTYAQLLEHIDGAAESLINLGITSGDRALMLLPNIPEAVFISYGLSKLGAVADHADPRSNPEIIKQCIDSEGCRMLFVSDALYPTTVEPVAQELLDGDSIKTIVIVPVAESLPVHLKVMSKLTDKPKIQTNGERISIWKSCKEAKHPVASFSEVGWDTLALIVHSSGTSSGAPKAIPLSCGAVTSFVEKHLDTEFARIRPGSRMLHTLPFFAAYGSVNTCHLSLCLGFTLVMIPQFEFMDFGPLVLRTKPNIILGVPNWFSIMARDQRLEKKSLSFVQYAIAGGDAILPSEESLINDFFERHASQCKVTKGHGMSELGGSGTFTFDGFNKPGSVGIAFPTDRYVAVDDNGEIVRIGNDGATGEAYIFSPSMTSGVLDGHPVAKIVDIGGYSFLKTGDVMTISRDATIAFAERADRSFTRFDGYKVRPSRIEQALDADPHIKDCLVTFIEDAAVGGKVPIAHIVPASSLNEKDTRKWLAALLDSLFQQGDLTSRDIPLYWNFLSKIPVTKMSKKDYRKLAAKPVSGREWRVVIDEDNLMVRGYELLSPRVGVKEISS